MASGAFQILCFLCIAIGLCLPIWSIYAFKDIKKFAKYPSVEHRSGSFLIFSCIIWCISCIAVPLFVYITSVYNEHSFDFHIRLILHSLELFFTLNIIIIKICKLHYNIHKLMDEEKWFCCHIIDKYWLHSLYIINYDIFGRSSNLLLFCSVYLCFGLFIITFSSIITLSSSNNILIEYLAFFIISTLPLILFIIIYKSTKVDEKYFVDDDYMLKEIFILILIYIFCIIPPFIAIIIFRKNYNIVLLTQITDNTISCSLSIYISVKCGVWAAMNRENIIKQEREKLYCNENDTTYTPSISTPSISQSEGNQSVKYRYVYLHSTPKTNKAHTPTSNLKMFAHRVLNKRSMSPLMEYKDNDDDDLINVYANVVDNIKMDKVFFADLLNFRFGFYCFSEYLRLHSALHYLSFIVEMNQFKHELYNEMDALNMNRGHKYEWMNDVSFNFLPRGDCLYINKNNIVFEAWNIYKKYIATNNHKMNVDIPINMVNDIGSTLQSIYQHYQFLYSQKLYYLKYKKNKKSISQKYQQEIMEETMNNEYQSLQQTSDDDYDDDEDIYDEENEYYALDPPIQVEPLILDDEEEDDEDDIGLDEINRILLINDIGNEDEKELEEEYKYLDHRNTMYDIKDIWSAIELETNSKISVEASTLHILSQIFEESIYLIWDKLLEFYQRFKEKSDDYLICRYKLRSSQKNYIRQKNHQKIKTPRNRKDPNTPFWSKKKGKSKSAFNYNNIQNMNHQNEFNKIQIVQYNQ